MKVTMIKTMCGPDGNAFPNMVINVPNDKAKELIAGRFAREFDASKDAKAKFGPVKGHETK